MLWDKRYPKDGLKLVEYKCRSWRCNGECARCAAKIAFARIKTALDGVNPDHVCFVVLTLDPAKWKPRKGLSATDRMYVESNALWKALQKRIERRFGKFKYITVVEQHASERPHFNVAIVSAEMATALARRSALEKQARRFDKKRGEWVISPRWNWLEDNAEECGFGRICYADLAKNRDAIAGYIVKAAGGGANSLPVAGEISKASQLPVSAPQHFRRIRASVGFLPPKMKNELIGGEMVFRSTETICRAVQEKLDEKQAQREVRALASARKRGEVVGADGSVRADLLGEAVRVEGLPNVGKFERDSVRVTVSSGVPIAQRVVSDDELRAVLDVRRRVKRSVCVREVSMRVNWWLHRERRERFAKFLSGVFNALSVSECGGDRLDSSGARLDGEDWRASAKAVAGSGAAGFP